MQPLVGVLSAYSNFVISGMVKGSAAVLAGSLLLSPLRLDSSSSSPPQVPLQQLEARTRPPLLLPPPHIRFPFSSQQDFFSFGSMGGGGEASRLCLWGRLLYK